MVHKHIKSLPHHPGRVIALSLIIATALGVWGYKNINKQRAGLLDTQVQVNTDVTPSNSHLTLGFLSGGRIKSVSVKAGDTVKKGQVLATLDAGNTLGALTQAKAALETAQANYSKIINGATGANIDIAKSAVHTAEVNLDGVTKQQDLLVKNARINLLNSTLTAKSSSDSSITPPVISGTYNKDTEGTITLSVYQTGDGSYFTISGISTGSGKLSSNSPQPIADTGLFVVFPATVSYISTAWDIAIPNKTAPNYLSNSNALQSAIETRSELISNAKAMLDQANASLTALVTAARPEDVAAAQAQVNNAKGAVQVAEASYNNTIITAPMDGVIASVSIAPGEIAVPNAAAIEFISSSN